MRRALRENAPCALGGRRGLRGARLARPLRARLERLRNRGRPAVEALRRRTPARLPRALPRLRRLADRARAVRAAARGLGRRANRPSTASSRSPACSPRRCSPSGSLARMRAEGRTLLARALASALLSANPVTLLALELGHPEELLGAAACVAAVLLAAAPSVSRRRALLAGALARPRDRQQAVGAARGRARAARAPARQARPRRARRGGHRRGVGGAAAARRAPAPSPRSAGTAASSSLADLPALAAALVLRPSRRARAWAVRRRQARLPRRHPPGRAGSATRSCCSRALRSPPRCG